MLFNRYMTAFDRFTLCRTWTMAFIGSVILTACQPSTNFTSQVNVPQINADELQAEKVREGHMIAESKDNSKKSLNRLSAKPTKEEQERFQRVIKRIEQAGADICREMNLPAKGRDCHHRFKVAHKKVVNAYVNLTTENMVVTTGMLRFVRSDDELAVVMGHELAHKLMGHTVVSGAFASYGKVKSMFAPPAEREADYVGFYIAARADYDIQHFADFLRRFSIHAPILASGKLSHPSNPERAVALQKVIDEIEYKKKHHIPLVPDFNKNVTSR